MPNFNFDIKRIVNNVCRLDDHISGNILGKQVHCGVTHLLPKNYT